MPRVNPLVADKKIQENMFRMTRELDHLLTDYRISYTAISKMLNKTPAAISRQFSPGNHITLEVWLAANELLEEKKNEEKVDAHLAGKHVIRH